MPIYEYRCQTCGHRLERLQAPTQEGPSCPACFTPMARQTSAPAFVLKGPGFYSVDYPKAGTP